MVYGLGDPLHRFQSTVKRIRDGRKHIIFPDTQTAWRGPRGYVENVAAAIALATMDNRSVDRIYSVCETPVFSELEWAQKIATSLNWSGEFVVMPANKVPPNLLMPVKFAQS